MREKALIAAVNRPIGKLLHHQSMTSGSLTYNGIPDHYYDGPARDFWIEFKVVEHMPRDGIVGRVDDAKRGCYSRLQYTWMERRYNNSLNLPHGPNVVGIIGLPNRKAVIQRSPTEWREGSSVSLAIPLKEVSEWVIGFGSHSDVRLVA